MPYTVKENAGKFDVVNTESDETVATHDDKESAERQVKLLHELEKEYDNDESD